MFNADSRCLLLLRLLASVYSPPSFVEMTSIQKDVYNIFRDKYYLLKWQKYWPIIEHSDIQYINHALAMAIVHQESHRCSHSYNPYSGATGDGQVIGKYHRPECTQAELKHYYRNIMISVLYLKQCHFAATGNLSYSPCMW